MKLNNDNAQLYVPDGSDVESAINHTDVLCIAAHQDDTEIMAYHAIEECFSNENRFFTSVIVTDGGGSPRTGDYASYTDEEMKAVRETEQNKAADMGKYSAQIHMKYPSFSVKKNNPGVVADILTIIKECKAHTIYTHNLADKHKTHVAVALRVIKALQSMDEANLPDKLIGLEVWRSLDWLNDESKVVYDASKNPDFARDLLEVFDSQIAGGKRYDEAALGRRKANATFFGDHRADDVTSAIYGIDMTELMKKNANPKDFIKKHIDDFKTSVTTMIDDLL